jgi:hypothetical protein
MRRGAWLAGAVALVLASGCDRTVGRLDLWILTSSDPSQSPFSDQVDRVRVRVEAPDLGAVVRELEYGPGGTAEVDGVAVGPRRVVTVEALSAGGAVLARGRSLPVDVGDGRTRVDVFVAWVDRFTAAAAALEGAADWTPRGGHTAVSLLDGRVALVGGGLGLDVETGRVVEPVRAAALFDPSSGRLVAAGSCASAIPGADPLCLAAARIDAAVGLAASGDLLVVGGETAAGPAAQVERLPRGALAFEIVGEPIAARLAAAFAPTRSGAAVVGGAQLDGTVLSSAVLFADGGHRASLVDGLLECERVAPVAAPVGQWVLLFGGHGADGLRADYELVAVAPDLRQGSCQPLPPNVAPRTTATATVVADRFVVIAGGLEGPDARGRRPVSRAVELLDTETNVFCHVGELASARSLHGAAALPGDRVLVVGGVGSTAVPTALPSFEILDIGAIRAEIDTLGIAVSCDDLAGLLVAEQQPHRVGRIAPGVVAMANDSVLVSGGFDSAGEPLGSVEVFVPSR